MTRQVRWMLVLFISLSACSATLAWAQPTTGEMTPGNWKQLLATILNTAGVMLVVQAIKIWRPYFADKYGWALPILATLAGPLVATLQMYLATKLGYSVDFSLITSALTGGAAVAANQVYAQAKQGPTGLAKTRP